MNRRAGSASDPLWFRDAVIYELHVKAFADANGDGVGDFQGLIGKLDYLQALGITCIWLLPFFPSPLKDDGYDISDYMSVHPSYGTLGDFKALLDAAHERELQVMIELIINHTSDQHPWFQVARNSPPGSPEREYYVWSDTDDRYRDARIIFTDTEKSNWTWDPVAKAYFWHRFFSHQPDLNFDNPAVLDEVLKVMRFWLDNGVDGLRLDAIPYLVERDGTNCENLPETHAVIKKIRAAMDSDYANRMILAEANQWPSDVRPYFGNGDECHMAFHFPLMPRIYMALRQEDRVPIMDIMSQTPDIPETCQWGLFLRNHDELTLEMVTNDERDYMYLAYSADPRTRINLGIRRRLAPLMDNNRRRIELLNSLLFSLPGTPIIYYGDEIGMGDNVYLGDRNGVRTPMQWNSDRNAGFSRATPAMLYSPVIMDPVWGYEAVNVEAEESDPSSLLIWMRNMIALRKLFRVFGRGTLRFLTPTNRKILAYLRSLDGEQVLCVTNLSRYAQPVDLDLGDLAGMTPIEMLGYIEFPAITRDSYRLTLSPYAFLWLELQGTPQPIETAAAPNAAAAVAGNGEWRELIPALEETILPAWLPKQRWFTGKSRQITSVRVTDSAEFAGAAVLFVHVAYQSGDPEQYFAPVLLREGSLEDALADDAFCRVLLNSPEILTKKGALRQQVSSALPPALEPARIDRDGVGQSAWAIIFDEKLVLKVFRRQQKGPNAELEIAEHLASLPTHAAPDQVPPYLGRIDYSGDPEGPSAIAILHGFVESEGDGWAWFSHELELWYDVCSQLNAAAAAGSALSHAVSAIEAARALGRITADLHVALSTPAGDSGFEPEEISPQEIQAIASLIHDEASETLNLLRSNLPFLSDDTLETAVFAVLRRAEIAASVHLADADYGSAIRVHGDYHLGQLLRTKDGFAVVDFEGEPAWPAARRRAKYSPLKDVASMICSFHYAAEVALINYAARRPERPPALDSCAALWEDAVSAEFLNAYLANQRVRRLLPAADENLHALLNAFRFEKGLHQLRYELNTRPAWVRIPLAGILAKLT